MPDRPRSTQDLRDEPERDVISTELGDVADPDAEAVGESLIDRSAEKAEPTI